MPDGYTCKSLSEVTDSAPDLGARNEGGVPSDVEIVPGWWTD